jgi:hypothetical protein
VTVSRVCDVDPPRGICWKELHCDGLCFDSSFVPQDVYMSATGIDKCHPCFVYMRFAGGIVAFIVRHRSGSDDDQAMPRMRVPAGASPGAQTLLCT